jgi:hypothetical protein
MAAGISSGWVDYSSIGKPDSSVVVVIEDPLKEVFDAKMKLVTDRLNETCKGTYSYLLQNVLTSPRASKKAFSIFNETIGKKSAQRLMVDLINSAKDPISLARLNNFVKDSGSLIKALKMANKEELIELARFAESKGHAELAESFLLAADHSFPFVVVQVSPESYLNENPDYFLDLILESHSVVEGDYSENYRFIDLINNERLVELIALAESKGHDGVGLILREELLKRA